jgi:hypothetical protein
MDKKMMNTKNTEISTQQHEIQIRLDVVKQKAPTCWRSCKDQ